MSAIPKNTFILLIVVALAAGSWPAALIGGTNTGVADPCCENEGPVAGSNTEDEECCPTGCSDCYLACCSGMISLLPSVTTMSSTQEVVAIVCRYHDDPPPARGGEIYHPPQA